MYRLEQIVGGLEKRIEKNSLKFADVTVYPEYEVSIDLNLEKNTHPKWSNIYTFIGAP